MGIIKKLKSILGRDASNAPSSASEQVTKNDTEPSHIADTSSQIGEESPEPPTSSENEKTSEDEQISSEPVDSIKGIGPAYAEQLRDAGITSVDELAKAEAKTLANQTGIGESRIQNWIDRANAP